MNKGDLFLPFAMREKGLGDEGGVFPEPFIKRAHPATRPQLLGFFFVVEFKLTAAQPFHRLAG